MDRDVEPELLVPAPLRSVPADLLVVVVVTLALDLFVLLAGTGLPVARSIAALVLLLVLPGYAFVSALFPESGACLLDVPTDTDDPLLLAAERFALSLVSSIIFVTLSGFVLVLVSVPLRVGPLLIVVTVLVVLLSALAHLRRQQCPPETRFQVSLPRRLSGYLSHTSRVDLLLNVVVVVCVLFAVTSVVYALAVPKSTDAYTELALQTDEDGIDRTAYPSTLRTGQAESVYVSVHNHEYEQTDYTLLIREQRVQRDNDTVTPLESNRLDTRRLALIHNETVTQAVRFEPTFVGENIRLQILLYRQSPPAEPTAENAYRATHLWLTVEESSS